jgi:phosphohistidine phosphatase SixA
MSRQRSSRHFHPFILLLWSWLIAVNLAHGETLAGQELIGKLRAGGYVLLMRHAKSPGAPPDAAHANADNRQHERQLDEEGMASSQAMGEALRRLHIPIGRVLSSPTYRALQTVKLLQVGPATLVEELGDAGHSMSSDNSGIRATRLKAETAAAPAAGRNTLIVTHYPNIMEAFAADAAGLSDGEALILHPDGHGGTESGPSGTSACRLAR